MLFSSDSRRIESEKERNLCSKFFSGYFFNELIEGYRERLGAFCKLVESGGIESFPGSPASRQTSIRLSSDSTNVTFDLHAYILHAGSDKGELADLFVWDPSCLTAIAVEAKFLEPWDFEKDVCGNAKRIRTTMEAIESRNGQAIQVIQCLLVTREKWNEVKKMKRHPGSNYRELVQSSGISLVVLTWESLIEICQSDVIRTFFFEIVRMQKRQFRKY